MRVIVCLPVTLLALGCGCSKQTAASNEVGSNAAAQQATLETYKNPEGIVYRVERVPNVKPEDLPVNSDFKMADKDIAKYAEDTLCAMDQGRNGTPRDRCDVYVQPDKNGTLIGYTAVTQDRNGVSFQTTATLNEKKAPPNSAGCGFGGKLYTSQGTGAPAALRNADKDFDGQFMYSAWEKEPGNWLVSPAGPDVQVDDDQNSQMGVWYVSKQGDKLHINQERWNYCYPDSSKVSVDDVFYRVLTLARNAPDKR